MAGKERRKRVALQVSTHTHECTHIHTHEHTFDSLVPLLQSVKSPTTATSNAKGRGWASKHVCVKATEQSWCSKEVKRTRKKKKMKERKKERRESCTQPSTPLLLAEKEGEECECWWQVPAPREERTAEASMSQALDTREPTDARKARHEATSNLTDLHTERERERERERKCVCACVYMFTSPTIFKFCWVVLGIVLVVAALLAALGPLASKLSQT